jgi:flagellar assembly protein FliH
MVARMAKILRGEEQLQVLPISWQESESSMHASPGWGRAGGSDANDAHREDARTAQDFHQLEQEAFERGVLEGKRVAGDQAAAEMQAIAQRLAQSLVELSKLRSRIRASAEGDLVRLATAVARKIVHRELTIDPDSVEGLIRVALDKLEGREIYRVRVHPDQEVPVRSAIARFSGPSNIEIVGDQTLKCGDVLFETPQGALDASVETQFKEIERGFADRLRR